MQNKRNTLYLNNMKLICSRLARTLEDLAEYDFIIKYTPGRLNTAADALSRLQGSLQVPSFGPEDVGRLPQGLVLYGQPSLGGGNSLFDSLHRLLQATGSEDVPGSPLQLRELLVAELLNSSDKFGIKLNKQSRRELRLMLLDGQLPCFEVLLACSKKFNVQVNVYFWSREPVVYCYGPLECSKSVVNLQCLAGIHFNPLIEVKGYVTPDVRSEHIITTPVVSESVNEQSVDPDNELEVDCVQVELASVGRTVCCHAQPIEPLIKVIICHNELCAVIDTGAEASLVDELVWKTLATNDSVDVSETKVVEIVGLAGDRQLSKGTVSLLLSINGFNIPREHLFIIVPHGLMPCCLLLGLDFLKHYNIDVDFNSSSCKQAHDVLQFSKVASETGADSFVLQSRVNTGVENDNNGDFRFKLEYDGEMVTGIQLLMQHTDLCNLQNSNFSLRVLRNCLISGKPLNKWPKSLKSFKRHRSKLYLQNTVIMHGSVPVVPFNLMVDLAVTCHEKYAHMGREKLHHMVSLLAWSVSRYKIVEDVCKCCTHCQFFKNRRTTVAPPTWKISTDRPFQMMAADLVSFSRTRQGHVCCLMMVDHYTKWVAAVPLRSKQSRVVGEAMVSQILPFLPKMPETLLTDNGPEFSSAYFSALLETWEINHIFTTPYHPASNGAIERVNRTVKQLLRSLDAAEKDWDVLLPQAIVAYNGSLHSQLGTSPSSFLLTGRHVACREDGGVARTLERWRQGHPAFAPFAIGELVLKRTLNHGHSNVDKFSPCYDGPYRVVLANDNGVTYQIASIDNNRIIKAHHTQLKKFFEIPAYLKAYMSLPDSVTNVFAPQLGDPMSLLNHRSVSDSSLDTLHLTTSTDESSFAGFPYCVEVVADVEGSGGDADLPISAVSQCKGCITDADLSTKDYTFNLHPVSAREDTCDERNGATAIILNRLDET